MPEDRVVTTPALEELVVIEDAPPPPVPPAPPPPTTTERVAAGDLAKRMSEITKGGGRIVDCVPEGGGYRLTIRRR